MPCSHQHVILQRKILHRTTVHEWHVHLNRISQPGNPFLQNEIGGKDLTEIRTKLNGRNLSEIIEQNEDFETEIDTLTRTKKELEADLLSQSNTFNSRIKEKEGIIKRLETNLKAEAQKVNKWFKEYKEVKDELEKKDK